MNYFLLNPSIWVTIASLIPYFLSFSSVLRKKDHNCTCTKNAMPFEFAKYLFCKKQQLLNADNCNKQYKVSASSSHRKRKEAALNRTELICQTRDYMCKLCYSGIATQVAKEITVYNTIT